MRNTPDTDTSGKWAFAIVKTILLLCGGLIAFLLVGGWIAEWRYTADLRRPWPTATSECLVAGQKMLSDEELLQVAAADHGGADDDHELTSARISWNTPESVRKDSDADNLPSIQERAEKSVRFGLKRWAYVHLTYREHDNLRGMYYDACGNRFD